VGGREGDLTPRLKHIEVERSLVTRGARNGYLLTAPLVAVVTLLVVAPLAVFLVYSFLSPIPFGVEPTFTLANYRTVVQEGIWWRLIRNSIQIGVTTAAVSVLLGLVLGYYLSFHAGRWKYLLLGATAVSILGGYLVRVYAWRTILGFEGVVNTTLLRAGLIDEPLRWIIFNRWAVTIALANIFIPFAAVMIFARLENINRSQIEAARDLGAGRWTAFWKVTLPLAGPAIFLSFVFVFLLSAADYITPQLLGGTRGSMIGVSIQDQFQRTGNWPVGSALGFTVVAVTAGCLAVVWLVLKMAGLMPKEARRET
jgi:spermidine/putrescine transport system permease protein